MAITIDTNTYKMRFLAHGVGPVKEAVITIPDADKNTDHTIVTPASGNSIFIVGMFLSENNPFTFKLKYSNAGGGKYKDLELAANQGIWSSIGEGYIPLPQDFPLIIQVSAEVTDLAILYVETLEMLI